MTTQPNQITREKLHQIFAQLKGSLPKEQPAVEVQEYNWKKPHHFQIIHEEALTEFTGLLMKNISKDFSNICHSQFQAKMVSVDEHYSSIFIDEILEEDGHYFIELQDNQGKICGILNIPMQAAGIWVVNLLQDSNANTEQQQKLSMLEETLLLDVGNSIISAISRSLKNRNCKTIKGSSQLKTDKLILHVPPLTDLFEIVFTIKNDNCDSEASVIIFSEMLDNIVGIEKDISAKNTPEALSNAMLNNMNKVSMPVRADIGQVNIAMSDIMSLRPGDIIQMDKKIEDKVQVWIKDQKMFSAYPVQSMGKYAVLVELDDE